MEEEENLKNYNLSSVAKKIGYIRNKMEELAEEESELKLILMSMLKKRDLTFYQNKYSEFRYYIHRSKRITDVRFLKIKNELKAAEEIAIKDGLFEEKKKEVVSYKKK